jgi:signal transduction histidine kinase/ligand-binding sensor domain-containing protein
MPLVLRRTSRLWARSVFLALLLGIAIPGAALSPNLGLLQIQHTVWTTTAGAPADIWALAQSPDGFLLLGTGSGLYRFDGISFERVVPSNQPDLAFRDITALLALPSGETWIGYYAGGVSELKAGVLTSYSKSDGVPSGWISSFARETDGTIWVTANEGLGRFSAGHWQTVSSDWNYRGHGAHWILLDHQGTLWVAGGETVEFLRRGAHKFEDTGIRTGYDATLTFAPDGTLWLGGAAVSPRPLVPGELSATRHRPPVPKLDPVKRIVFDRDGSLWATDSVRGGIYRVVQHGADADSAVPQSKGVAEIFTEAEGLTSNMAVPLMEDQEGNIWVGTNLGLNRFRAPRVVREPRVPTSPKGYALAADPNGSVWIGSGDELFEARGSRCDLVARLRSPIRSAYRAPSGELWLGTHGGLVELLNNKLLYLPLPAPAAPVEYEYVHAITSDSSNGMWVSVVDRGLLRLGDRRWDHPSSDLSMSDATPTSMWTDSAQRQWFGYSDGKVWLRAGDATRVFGPEQGLRVGPINLIRGGSATEIFVAGEWGLARFDGQQFRSLSASRSDILSGITGIIVRAKGDVWLNSNRGVVHMSSAAINDAYDNPASKLRYELFDVQDGLPGYAQQGEDATAVAGADGRLWFATNHGVAWIDPEHPVANPIPPHVVIRSVLVDQRAYLSAGPIELSEATRSVRIDYTAPSLAAPERVRFRYKLDGADDGWRDAGTERSVRYANLHPGAYTFRVIASNGDGLWNDVDATVTFALRPAFYQTPWFVLLVSAAGLGALSLLLFARVRQLTHKERKRLEQRMEVRLSERTRIARELHDSMLQGFQGLMFHLQAVRELLPKRPVAAASSLDAALHMGDEAIFEGRDAVQNLRSSALEEVDLVSALGSLGAELGQAMGPQVAPEYLVMIEGTQRDINPNVRDDIYGIAREAVRNVYQHAQAKHIEIEVTFGQADLNIRIRDDGIGIDSSILARGQLAQHWGLPGMRERGEAIDGQVKVWSEKGVGTEIDLRLPAEIAYAQPPMSTYNPITRLLILLLRWRANRRRGHNRAR